MAHKFLVIDLESLESLKDEGATVSDLMNSMQEFTTDEDVLEFALDAVGTVGNEIYGIGVGRPKPGQKAVRVSPL